ncbi:MAG: ABC transporter permease [Usitatibacter sp.]
MNPLAALVRKDLVLYFSNRRAVLITLAAPILIAAFFGSIMGGAPKAPARVPIAVTDLDASEVSKSMVAAMKADTTFALEELPEPAATARVREGKVRAAIVIPAGFGDAATRALFRPGAKKPEVVLHYDPSQAMMLAMVKGLLTEHAMKAVSRSAFSGASGMKAISDSRAAVRSSAAIDEGQRKDLLSLFDSIERLQARGSAPGAPGDAAMQGLSMPFAMSSREVTSGGNRKYNGYAHSFAGMGVQFILFMGIELGVGLLLMRRAGLWKRLRAAPVSRALLLGSRIASGTAIALILLVGIYAAGIAVFGVRIEGSVAGFVAVAVAFALLASTFGLLIAALGRTPEATRGIAILATLLLVMLGGAWVPTFIFPEWLQAATLVVPTRWAVDGLDAMTWRGLGAEAAVVPVAAMLACSALFAWVSVKRFDWEE